jgi:hypothetical protein
MFYLAKQRESILQRKYELLVTLREVLYLCRQHRNATHHALMFGEDRQAELLRLAELLHKKTDDLVSTAHFDHKPMYRVFQQKMKSLTTDDWSARTISRNQMIHGKTIRHCMFLMDELILSWLVDVSREDLTDEYHMDWQLVIDSMDALTRLRIAIEEMNTPDGWIRMQQFAQVVHKKINQLEMINPLPISTRECTTALQILEKIVHSPDHYPIEMEAMYQLTTSLSLSIAHVYDHILGELTETLYIPLPKLLSV